MMWKTSQRSGMKRHDAPDLVVRGGSIADGIGGDLFVADVAITDGRIAEIGKVTASAKDEIDARGKLVTPGFVDIHTDSDGQVTWSQDITPSSQNGVTTAIMGNCGVGFAPRRPADHVRLIQLMEGVEDIPEPVLERRHSLGLGKLSDSMHWLSQRHFDIDIGEQLPHAVGRGASRAVPTKRCLFPSVIPGQPAGLNPGSRSSPMIHCASEARC